MSEKETIFGSTIPEKVLLMGDWNSSPLKFFASFDGTYVNREVNIGNHALRKIMKKNFEYMSRNIFFISAFGRFLLGADNIESVLEAEKIAANTINNALDKVTRRVEQAEALLSHSEITEATHNGKSQTMMVPLTSPGARKYVELLVKSDYFYNLNALLWINGEIDDRNKFENESAVRKEVQAAVRGIANQFGYVLNLTRKKSPEEASKIGSHDEDKLASEAEGQVGELGKSAANIGIEPKSDSPDQPAEKKKKPAKGASTEAAAA